MRSSTRQERRRGAKRFKPQCEQLEVRAVPSAVPLLTSALDVNFSSTNLPADWQTTNWDPTTPGGTATVTGGQLVVDGARAGTQALFGPGRTLEFVATLSGDAFQNIGFGTDFSGGTPWAIFSTFTGGGLYARVSGGPDQLIAGNWLGTAHDFVINWTSTDITFSIDGNQVASDHVAISNSMRVLIGDFQVGGGA